jgi:putative tricarboxylic transport membrane protein
MTERHVALTILAASIVYAVNGLGLPRGTIERPGAGFFPLAVAVFAIGVTLAWVVLAFRHVAAGRGQPLIEPGARVRVLGTGGVLVGFCLLMPWLGYPLAAFLFCAVMLRSLGGSWVLSLVTALLAAVVSYYLFATLLGVPLPVGALLG